VCELEHGVVIATQTRDRHDPRFGELAQHPFAADAEALDGACLGEQLARSLGRHQAQQQGAHRAALGGGHRVDDAVGVLRQRPSGATHLLVRAAHQHASVAIAPLPQLQGGELKQ